MIFNWTQWGLRSSKMLALLYSLLVVIGQCQSVLEADIVIATGALGLCCTDSEWRVSGRWLSMPAAMQEKMHKTA